MKKNIFQNFQNFRPIIIIIIIITITITTTTTITIITITIVTTTIIIFIVVGTSFGGAKLRGARGGAAALPHMYLKPTWKAWKAWNDWDKWKFRNV